MADNRSMNTCVILLALIACSHAILWAEGRKLKFMENEETAKHGSKNTNLQLNSGELKEDYLSTKLSVDIPSAENAVSVTGKKEIYPPMRLVESAASDTDDFRPTTPGNSPGAGHKHAEEDKEVDFRVKGDKNTTVTAAIAIEFPPTTPTLPFGTEGRQLKFMENEETAKHGSKNTNLQQNSGELKEDYLSTKPSVDIPYAENAVSVTGKKEIYPPMGLVESAASDTDDFRPTTPGNSPGAGHKHAEEDKEVDFRVKGDKNTTVTAAIAIEFPPTAPTLPFRTEGRQLKFMENEETAKHGSKNTNLQQNSGELKEDYLSTKQSVDIPSAENAVSVTGKKEIYPPMRLVESAASDTDDFRPTTPGNSPGAGHKHAEEDKEVDSRVKGDKNTIVTAAIAIEFPPTTPTLPFGTRPTPKHADGFRPTAPGHNPRVGHAIQN